MDIDLEELAAIIELLDKTEFTQFRFEKGDLRIAVSRGGEIDSGVAAPVAPAASSTVEAPVAVAPQPVQPVQPVQPAESARSTPPAPASSSSAPAGEPTLGADEVLVRSPLLGTFYRSPKPGEAPYVEIGDKVEADATLCIVEVMKLMNSVTAGAAGEVTRILVSDGDLVEFDQPLFVVRRLS